MSPPLHVVAAVLRDARGRVLLAQRPEGKADAGLWEFPGGKVDAGETALAALRRELHEELAVDFASAEPLICVPVAGEGGSIRLRLDTWRVDGLSREPRALEHAALAWVEPAELGRYPMPPADRPVVAALTMPERVLITPEPGDGPAAEAAFVESVERALERGLRRVQLRMAPVSDPGDPHGAARIARIASALAAACQGASATLLLHGLENAALAARLCVGLHLRARELSAECAAGSIAAARTDGRPTGGAVHGIEEIRRAEALGLDDLLLGPVRPTPSHPGQPGLGWERFEALRAQTALPVFALGGVGEGELDEARRHGAQGVAGIRGFWPDQPAR